MFCEVQCVNELGLLIKSQWKWRNAREMMNAFLTSSSSLHLSTLQITWVQIYPCLALVNGGMVGLSWHSNMSFISNTSLENMRNVGSVPIPTPPPHLVKAVQDSSWYTDCGEDRYRCSTSSSRSWWVVNKPINQTDTERPCETEEEPSLWKPFHNRPVWLPVARPPLWTKCWSVI